MIETYNINSENNKLLILVYNYLGNNINKFRMELTIPHDKYNIITLNETIQKLLLKEHKDRKAVQFFFDNNATREATKHVIMEVARYHVVVFS